MNKFRVLRADEVEARVAQVFGEAEACTLLLYKDARCDMSILDEAVGPMNWQRHHTRDNANCIVSIWDSEKQQWIDKEDTGSPSNTEAQKGLASDSFKRACVNWGIGRELYTAPFIYIPQKGNYETRKDKNGKMQPKIQAKVTKLEIEETTRTITGLEIVNEKMNNAVIFRYPAKDSGNVPPQEYKPKNISPMTECWNEAVRLNNGVRFKDKAEFQAFVKARVPAEFASLLNNGKDDMSWITVMNEMMKP